MTATRNKRRATSKRSPSGPLSRWASIALAIGAAVAVATAVGVAAWRQGEPARIERERRIEAEFDRLEEEGRRHDELYSTPEQRASRRREVAESRRLWDEHNR